MRHTLCSVNGRVERRRALCATGAMDFDAVRGAIVVE
jgi:hypothetical protein